MCVRRAVTECPRREAQGPLVTLYGLCFHGALELVVCLHLGKLFFRGSVECTGLLTVWLFGNP